MNKKKPVNLDLTTISFPPMAIASFLHRLSGIVLFLLTPVMLYLLAKSLSSPESFMQTKDLIQGVGWKVLVWMFCAALIYHFFAGIRHLCMDLGYGEEVNTGRVTAWTVIVVSIIVSILAGIWLW